MTAIAKAAGVPRRPSDTGLPDPRPIPGYTATYSEPGGNSVVTIALDQPCIIRLPQWAFVSSANGTRVYAASVSIADNRTFSFIFIGKLPAAFGFIEVPYQDMQVQNFQGGFVKPGAQWFRATA
jgi:hypothetical protein